MWWSDEVRASEENRETMTKRGISDLELKLLIILSSRQKSASPAKCHGDGTKTSEICQLACAQSE